MFVRDRICNKWYKEKNISWNINSPQQFLKSLKSLKNILFMFHHYVQSDLQLITVAVNLFLYLSETGIEGVMSWEFLRWICFKLR